MSLQTLVSAEELFSHIGDPNWAIVDCRFTLGEPERGRQDYLEAHIPGAVYAHLDEDLCSPHVPGITGRHPLPPVDAIARKFSDWGIGSGVGAIHESPQQVVAYDDWPGPSVTGAARLWWALRWLGHTAVAVLDGGWNRWRQLGGPIKSGTELRPHRDFIPRLRPELSVNADEVESMLLDPAYRLIDSRSADRYRGENETIDPVAGRIPGAINAPYMDNVGPNGMFRPVDELRQRFQSLLGDVTAQNAAFYCGSGVTAAHNVLALMHAGLGEAQLYAGSWSEWITDPRRPVERG